MARAPVAVLGAEEFRFSSHGAFPRERCASGLGAVTSLLLLLFVKKSDPTSAISHGNKSDRCPRATGGPGKRRHRYSS